MLHGGVRFKPFVRINKWVFWTLIIHWCRLKSPLVHRKWEQWQEDVTVALRLFNFPFGSPRCMRPRPFYLHPAVFTSGHASMLPQKPFSTSVIRVLLECRRHFKQLFYGLVYFTLFLTFYSQPLCLCPLFSTPQVHNKQQVEPIFCTILCFYAFWDCCLNYYGYN